jgi:Carboxypeptidase regulatory-like domain/TonB dependent receptor
MYRQALFSAFASYAGLRLQSRFCRLLCAGLVLAFLISGERAFAQSVGAILGTVTDNTGGVIPNAKVTATRTDTGTSQSTVTGAAGTFIIPNLPVGLYTITAESNGFKRGTAEAIKLDVSQQRTVDFKLTLAGTESTVEVTAAPPLLNTTDATLAGLVSQEQVETLPLNGRSIQNLVMLQPGMAQDTGSMGWMAPQWISNGNRGETEVATLDNSDVSDSEMGTIQFWNFNLDAIAEFKVLQLNYTAEYGQGGGTVTQMVSKSGTNEFHGSAFEFIRNSALDARNFFATSVPPFQRNEFGVTFGGPIVKNKTFFFMEYAGYRQRLGEPTVMSVPTAQERQGVVTLSDGNVVQVPLNSVAQKVLNSYPLPNQPGGIYGANTLNVLFKQPTDTDQGSIRLDQHFSDKDSLFFRASIMDNRQNETDAVAAIENPSFSLNNINNPRNFVVSETHIFSPTLLNVFTFTLNRQIEGSAPGNQAYPQTTFTDSAYSNWGPDTFITQYNETYFVPQDSFTWTKGRHTFNIGGSFRRGRDNGFGVTSAGPNGVYAFSPGVALTENAVSLNGGGSLLAGTASPSSIISMMEGISSYYKRATTAPGYGPSGGGAWWGVRVWHLNGWLQDNFQVNSKFTLNLGVRYEYNSVPVEVGNRFGQIVDYGTQYGEFVVNPKQLYPPDYKGIAPRVGLAYKITPKTVFRSGFAIFTNTIPTVYPDQSTVNFPMSGLSFDQNAPYSMTPLPVSLPPLTTLSGQVVPPQGNTKLIPANTAVNLSNIAAQIGSIGGDYPSDTLRNGYTMSANATLEQELPGLVNLQISYVMNNGIHLYNQAYPNAFSGALPQYAPFSQVTPGLGELQIFYNGARSNYNALQVGVRKAELAHGLQFQANYTWSRDITDADAVWSAPGASGGVTLNNPQCLRCEYGPASYNVRQRVSLNLEYDVPENWGVLPRRLTNGWKALGIFSAQSGFPFTVVGQYGTLQYGYDSFDGVGARPFLVQTPTYAGGGPQIFSNAVVANNGLNTQFFSTPLTTSSGSAVQTAPGNLGRNTFSGPGWWNMDFSLVKDTSLTERYKLQFRAEFFNIFNVATFSTPGTNGSSGNVLGSPGFGYSSTTATAERQIQFGLRLMF